MAKKGTSANTGRKRKIVIIKKTDYFTAIDSRWMEKYELLKRFIKTHGHANVPQTLRKKGKAWEARLATWVMSQRRLNRSSELLSVRKKKLLEVGFDFYPHETQWNMHVKEISQYIAAYGHSSFHENDPEFESLQSWADWTRKCYREGRLSKEKIKQLLSVGFVFNINENGWQFRIAELKDYRAKFGHVCPGESEPGYEHMAQWIYRIRRARLNKPRAGTLSPQQIAELDTLGFVWDFPTFHWNMMFESLRRFWLSNGHYTIPLSLKIGFRSESLSLWAASQRRNKKTLSKHRLKLLKSISFNWEGPKQNTELHDWPDRCARVTELKKQLTKKNLGAVSRKRILTELQELHAISKEPNPFSNVRRLKPNTRGIIRLHTMVPKKIK